MSKWAASVAMAKLFAQIPPTISSTMKNRHKILAKISRFRAFLSIPPSRSPVWQCRSVVVEIKRNVIDFCPNFSTKIFSYYKSFNLFPCEIWRKIPTNSMYNVNWYVKICSENKQPEGQLPLSTLDRSGSVSLLSCVTPDSIFV